MKTSSDNRCAVLYFNFSCVKRNQYIQVFIKNILRNRRASGLVGRIPACHAGGPGSNPGWRTIFYNKTKINIFKNLFLINIMNYKQILKNIKDLKIQGATNVMKAGLDALKIALKDSKNIYKDFKIYSEEIAWIRPTEPLLRNGLLFLERNINERTTYSELEEMIEKYKKIVENANEKIAEIGAKRIRNGSTIMTICHSSTVMNILKKAKDMGKEFKVFTCETRPRFQGRISAKELADHGIEVIYIVDSAKAFFMENVDMCLIGADAITSSGKVVNKVGSLELALCAKEERVKFVVASTLLKYDVKTKQGYEEPIEFRDPEEVWFDAPKNIKILNPAFDVVDQIYIDYIITESGIINPYMIPVISIKEYDWLY